MGSLSTNDTEKREPETHRVNNNDQLFESKGTKKKSKKQHDLIPSKRARFEDKKNKDADDISAAKSRGEEDVENDPGSSQEEGTQTGY